MNKIIDGRRAGTLTSAALVSLLCTAAGADGPQPPPSVSPIQAWVLDGAYQASVLSALAFTDTGLVAHTANFLDCPDGPAVTPGFASLSPQHVGAFAGFGLPVRFGTALDPSFFPAPLPGPIDPALVDNDCEALAQEAAVQTYVAGLQAQIQALAGQVAACVQDVRQLVCDVRAAADAAAEKCAADPPDPPGCGNPSGPGSGDCVPGVPAGSPGLDPPLLDDCFACRQALGTLPGVVGIVATALANCQDAKTALQADLNTFLAYLSGGGSYPIALAACVEQELAGSLDEAEHARSRKDDALSQFTELSQACSHENLVAGCDLCPEPPGQPAPALGLSGAVSVQISGRHLGHLAGALQSAAAQSTDPSLEQRYTALASRLRGLPDGRVLEMAAPADEPFSQRFVALRPSGLPDDGRVPLAVILTFVRSLGDPAPLNRADRDLLQQVLETFKDTLVPGR